MFATCDWTHPQVGGLLSEVIVKEERQLREPKPKMEVKHVWDPVALATRDSDWPDRQPRLNGPMYLQNRGTQMRGCLEYRGEPHIRSSRVIGSDPLCQRPERSRYARAKPFPDPAVHSRNAPDRCQAERRERELRTQSRPWRTEPKSQPLPALVPRSAMSSFCLRPGEMPLDR